MAKINIDRALVDSIKADLIKGEVKVTIRMPLETGLDIRAELSHLAEYEQPISVEIKPWQSRLPFLDVPTMSSGSGEDYAVASNPANAG